MSCQNQVPGSRAFLQRLHQEMAKLMAFPNQEFPHGSGCVGPGGRRLGPESYDLLQPSARSRVSFDEVVERQYAAANVGLKKSAIQGLDYPADRI